MPELPEVHTTATMLHKLILHKTIVGVWSNYESNNYIGKENIKNNVYFKKFKKEILNTKIKKLWRRAKYIVLELENNIVIVIHMKMTGHLLYGKYVYNKNKKEWISNELGPLQDPFNRFIHFVITFSDDTHLALSDMRKFATISYFKNKKDLEKKFKKLGPEPLDKNFNWIVFKNCLSQKPKQKIKTILLDQNIIAGIGNIYSDEILWKSYIHPERTVLSITNNEYLSLTKNTKNILFFI